MTKKEDRTDCIICKNEYKLSNCITTAGGDVCINCINSIVYDKVSELEGTKEPLGLNEAINVSIRVIEKAIKDEFERISVFEPFETYETFMPYFKAIKITDSLKKLNIEINESA